MNFWIARCKSLSKFRRFWTCFRGAGRVVKYLEEVLWPWVLLRLLALARELCRSWENLRERWNLKIDYRLYVVRTFAFVRIVKLKKTFEYMWINSNSRFQDRAYASHVSCGQKAYSNKTYCETTSYWRIVQAGRVDIGENTVCNISSAIAKIT